MTWQKYTLVFKLLSQLHVGYRKVGNLLQTRKYVPGKLIWAALTARLTRDFADGGDANKYREIGDLLKEHFRFGYFYPALAEPNTTNITVSKDLKKHYFWCNEADFDYRFLNSYASTALNSDFQSAEEGSLHEVEFIAPKTRPLGSEDVARQVYLKGEIYLDDSQPLSGTLYHWQDALQNLQLGAERNYGLGRVELMPFEEPQAASIQIELEEGQKIRAHALANNQLAPKHAVPIQGQVEPLLGWERAPANSQGKHWQISSPFVCYVPGSRVREKMKLEISEDYGLLKPVPID